MTTWWVWVALAVAFGALEVVLPVWAFLGFAAGAAATGLLLLLGAGLSGAGALLVFALLSAVAFGALRTLLGPAGGRARVIRHDINDG